MNIFLRELKANFKSLIIWSVIVILFVVVGFSKFTAYEGNPEMLAILDAMPPAVISAMNLTAFNLTTVTGFYGIMFSYFGLMISIAAAMWGSDIISKEERDKTVEFALTLPVTRARLLTAKIAAALVNCIILLLVTWAVTLVGAAPYQKDKTFYTFVALASVALFVTQLIFLAVGIFLGAALKQYKRAGSLAVSVLLGSYFLSVIAGLSKDLDFLKYFSPFKYFNPVQILNESKINIGFSLLSLAIITVLIAGAYVTYQRRDLYI